jgi:hypothetical protein
MPILTKPAFGPQTAITYITIGALALGWTLVWYFTLAPDPLPPVTRFLLIGLLVTGVIFVAIGALLGPIGRAARQAELPPAEAVRIETDIQKAAAVAAAQAAPAPPAPNPAVPTTPPAPPGSVLAQPNAR